MLSIFGFRLGGGLGIYMEENLCCCCFPWGFYMELALLFYMHVELPSM